jgi:hypothetical protein
MTTTAAILVGLALTGAANAASHGHGSPGSGGSGAHLYRGSNVRAYRGTHERNHSEKYERRYQDRDRFDKHEHREHGEFRTHREPFRDYKGFYYRGKENHFWSRCYWDRNYGCRLYWCPVRYCWFYWCQPYDCYLPIDYCPTGCYAYDG